MYGIFISDPPSTPTFSINGQRMEGTLEGTLKVINNTDVVVNCTSDSKPPPTYKWLYKGSWVFQDVGDIDAFVKLFIS